MKRFLAILLLCNLLFNSFGYRLVCFLIEKNIIKQTEARLDANNYDESKLIEIRIPLKLPYTTEWKDFERFDGEIELNGIYYKYVKRKVIVDSLVLLCLPDKNKHRIESARDQFFELVNGLKHPLEKKSETSSIFKTLISDYISKDNSWSLTSLPNGEVHFELKNSTLISFFNFQKVIKPPAISA
ncbi:MAG: hypothetical protein JWN56_2945 [Sphingobacteriales bacterium]|nr:hypothetical protein [Sphingobacteriales bacterium]